MSTIAPWVGRDNAEVTTLSATPNTVVLLPIPGTFANANRPRAFSLRFEDGSGGLVAGRFALAGPGTLVGLGLNSLTNTDGKLGYTRDSWSREWIISKHATQIAVASNTASAVCYLTWLY
jgi:hypothetical protein